MTVGQQLVQLLDGYRRVRIATHREDLPHEYPVGPSGITTKQSIVITCINLAECNLCFALDVSLIGHVATPIYIYGYNLLMYDLETQGLLFQD